MDHSKKRICVAKIVSVHGVKGAVKIKSFTENTDDFNKYGSLFNDEDSVIEILPISSQQDMVLAYIKNVVDREAAENFVGKNLYIARSMLPPPSEDEYYVEDLVGMDVVCSSNRKRGVVKYLHNFGGGDIIEILFDGDHYQMLAFTKENFPEINFEKNFIKTSLF